MRKTRIAPGEYYHIYNRGIGKQTIFHDKKDYTRFLFLVLYFQSSVSFPNIGRLVKQFVQHRVLNNVDVSEITVKRKVELSAFCIMPNHFHLIVKEREENAISAYMQRVLNAYAKYFNTKYDKSGHVFQGPYRAVLVEDDNQLLYLSAYIHRNPREIPGWLNREQQYEWSSYLDFVEENRWGDLLLPDIVLDQFENKNKYKKFIQTSTSKLLEKELDSLAYL